MNRHNQQAIRKLKQEFASFQARLNAILAEIEHQNNVQSCSLPEVQACIDAVCRHYRVDQTDIMGPRRVGDIALARQVAMYLARKTSNYRDERIAACFNRERTTVPYTIEAIEERMEWDKGLKAFIEKFIHEVRS